MKLSLRLQQQRKDPEADVMVHMERDACPGRERAPPYRKHCGGGREGRGPPCSKDCPGGRGVEGAHRKKDRWGGGYKWPPQFLLNHTGSV